MNATTNARRFERGEINVLLIPLILMVLFFVSAAGFGVWAYTERADYKDNSDQKAAAAAEIARRDEGIIKDKAYAEAEKQPLTSFDGPSAFGSVHVDYPKTWSVYVDSKGDGSQPLDAYFNPRAVPSTGDQTAAYALRIEVVESTYAKVLNAYNSYAKNKQVTVVPYTLPKVPGVVGVKVDGLVRPGKKTTGSMIIMPLRDKTIQVWTENAQSIGDFNSFILPNMTFAP
jgi:hypothetical protein